MERKLLVLSVVALASFGCTDAKFSRVTNFGASAEITCYSGGKPVYHGMSTGKLVNLQGDGISFVEKGSNDLLELRMDCVTRYK